jgi:hypothetical protein
MNRLLWCCLQWRLIQPPSFHPRTCDTRALALPTDEARGRARGGNMGTTAGGG